MWTDFAVIAGSASGALTGLLFVAVSLNRERLNEHPALRSEAGQTLVLFLPPLIRLARLLDSVTLNLVTTLLVLVAGTIELAGADGLYWLAPALIVALVNGVVNAWLFLTR